MGPKVLLLAFVVCMGLLSAEGIKCYIGPAKAELDCSTIGSFKTCMFFKDSTGAYTNGACWAVDKSGCEPTPAGGGQQCYCASDFCNKGNEKENPKDPNKGKEEKKGNNGAAAFKNSIPVLSLVAIFTTVAARLC